MDIYSEIILDYFKNPRNKGKLKNPTLTCIADNPMCGDSVRLSILLDKKGKVEKASFDGSGCAISQATASMLTEKMIGKTLPQLKKLTKEDIVKMLGIRISSAREKCALLALSALKNL